MLTEESLRARSSPGFSTRPGSRWSSACLAASTAGIVVPGLTNIPKTRYRHGCWCAMFPGRGSGRDLDRLTRRPCAARAGPWVSAMPPRHDRGVCRASPMLLLDRCQRSPAFYVVIARPDIDRGLGGAGDAAAGLRAASPSMSCMRTTRIGAAAERPSLARSIRIGGPARRPVAHPPTSMLLAVNRRPGLATAPLPRTPHYPPAGRRRPPDGGRSAASQGHSSARAKAVCLPVTGCSSPGL